MSELAIKGKKQTTIFTIVVVIITLLGLVVSGLTGDVNILEIIKDLLTLICVCFLYKGKNWARILLIVWLSIGGVISIIAGVLGLLLSPALGILLIVSSAISLGIAIFLGVNRAIKEYFSYCKN